MYPEFAGDFILNFRVTFDLRHVRHHKNYNITNNNNVHI